MKRNIGRIGVVVSVAGLTLCGLAATGVSAESGSTSGELAETTRTARQTDDSATTDSSTTDATDEVAVADETASDETTASESTTTTAAAESDVAAEDATADTSAAAEAEVPDYEYKEVNAITAPPAGFSATSCITTDFGGIRLMQYDPATPAVATNIPAGRLWISQADSHDQYESRRYVLQPNETWYLEFLGADGSVLATSATTGDVPDYTIHGRWIGSLGIVELAEPAVAVRAVHTQGEAGFPNSVHISSVVVCEETPVVSTTTSTTTADDSTTTPDPTVQPATTLPEVTTTLDPPDPTVKPATTTPDPTVKPATTTPTSTLPVTGSESNALAGTGIALFLAGTALVVTARRRATAEA